MPPFALDHPTEPQLLRRRLGEGGDKHTMDTPPPNGAIGLRLFFCNCLSLWSFCIQREGFHENASSYSISSSWPNRPAQVTMSPRRRRHTRSPSLSTVSSTSTRRMDIESVQRRSVSCMQASKSGSEARKRGSESACTMSPDAWADEERAAANSASILL